MGIITIFEKFKMGCSGSTPATTPPRKETSGTVSIKEYPNGVKGFVKAGFEPVMEKFCTNYEAGHDKDSQLCVYVGEEVVVDLWGSNPENQCIGFSNSKTVSAIQIACLADKGLLKYSDKVA